ncbi:MAG: alkaline phosphatase family protein, partial [Gemmatimonas sp.]
MRPSLLPLVIVCALRLGAQTTGTTPHPVVLISIDGLKPEYVLGADEHGLKIPNLRALVARGAHASGVTGVVPTV